jgi:cell wall assembly regulator SMI1
MQHIWERIKTWLAEHHAHPVLSSLAPGASVEQLQAFEAKLGRPLPEDLARSYRIHDGQRVGRGFSDRFVYGDQLYPLTKMLSRWKSLAELATEPGGPVAVIPVGPVRPIRDSVSRVPVASDDGSHYYFLDFDPASGGHVGQIVLSFHDERKITCVASSFRAWLEAFANQLDAGRYLYSDRVQGLIPVEWA